ncbi:hypothetical protein [Phenylobacterium sp.]|uniref:hypothetical protein n=1 Tax=Phenylobacterium sp. TaxID=1871053 RepID=UPI0035AE4E15
MKKILIALAAVSAAATTALPAAAAPAAHAAAHAVAWTPIEQRQAELDRRIDMGVRQHTLTRAEATRLRAEFNRIERLEHQYRKGGLSRWEMADLDRRMDALSRQIRIDRHDVDRPGASYAHR